MPGPEEHRVAVEDRGTVGAEIKCETCGYESHAPSVKVAELLAAEHRATPEYADQQGGM